MFSLENKAGKAPYKAVPRTAKEISKMGRRIGILTSGGDCPGLNAAIRAVGKAVREEGGITLVGFRDGFRGLVFDKSEDLDAMSLSGIISIGGTILGTSRDKPHRMPVGGKELDMCEAAAENYRKHGLEAIVCIGGGGTQKNALKLKKMGLNVVTIPKTIDNDIPCTDTSIGFDTALGVCTDAIDRLHSTAMSHQRIIVVEIMGHRAGWLALAAGMAGGADVILIPEIPYTPERIAEAVKKRKLNGKRFSIVAVAEGAMSLEDAAKIRKLAERKDKSEPGEERGKLAGSLSAFHKAHAENTLRLTNLLENMTGIETRLTILGHLQRGGSPSGADRLLATRLGTACVEAVEKRRFGVMIAVKAGEIAHVPIEDVAGEKKLVPGDHEWIQSARSLGTSFGD